VLFTVVELLEVPVLPKLTESVGNGPPAPVAGVQLVVVLQLPPPDTFHV